MRLHRIVVPARAPAGKGLTSMASSPLSPPRGHCRRNRTSSRAPSACSSDVGSATDTGASGSCACSRLGSREAASADSGTASDRGVLLFYYLLFGGLHELCHLAVAASAARFLHHPCFAGTESGVLLETVRHAGGTAQFLLRTFLLRRTEIPYLRCTSEVDGICVADVGGEGGAIDPAASLQTASDIIRHSGWIFSVLLAILVLLHHRQDMQPSSSSTRSVRLLVFLSSRRPSAMAVAAALITALEALSTDLLGIDALPIFDQSALSSTSSSSSRPMPTWTFLCGNFGLIILNSAWTTADGGRHTLDLLEKMVSVTMMRGAQSGGVLTFAPSRTRPSGSDPLVAFRSRVVNRKRSDLSHLLRTRVARDIFSTMSSAILSGPTACKTMKSGGGVNSAGGLGRNDTISVQTYSGHTRFATSSKATLDGTHPQRWSDPSYRTYYNFRSVANDPSAKQQASKNGNRGSFPFRTRVENYVTHNGDFDFYSLNGKVYDLDIVRPWLEMATCRPCPSTVDSACIAGFVDLIRSKGCFALSARYSACLGMPTCKITCDPKAFNLPIDQDYERVGHIFEEELDLMLQAGIDIESVNSDAQMRQLLSSKCVARLQREGESIRGCFSSGRWDEEDGGGLKLFASVTVDAFFDNDLLNTMKMFLANASGSFGLCIQSSLDAHHQLCLAARGQTISIAFYPSKGIVCYGSEQAAVKVGMNADLPFGETSDFLAKSYLDIDHDDLRLDLDELGGEVCLIDWGERRCGNPAVSPPNRHIVPHRVMNGDLAIYLLNEGRTAKSSDLELYHRMTKLTRNPFIKSLPALDDNPVLEDIRDIPRVCREIQEDWRNVNKTKISFNRLTAWNLARCIRKRMDSRVRKTAMSYRGAVDILVTGCEVSLWLGEQFASDLQKAFPGLNIVSVSSNKLLGIYGQEMSIPAIGFGISENTPKLDDAIVIIVSHSGGTFAPLAISNLLNNNAQTFVVTSEWDVPIAKQLRDVPNGNDRMMSLFNSRVFTTEVGMRPAEPCSVSVAGTQQLLTCIFEHICIIVLSDHRYRHVSGAIITEHDLKILERCNQNNIGALEQIVGVSSHGVDLQARSHRELRDAGKIWANHVLENARAYIMTFIYIFATVVGGYPLATGIATRAGLTNVNVLCIFRLIDAFIYFCLPQINVIIVRLVQKRALKHRMVGRTVIIADCPWVSQAAEAFLSKIFAVSYSIAGLNVLSGNPADHFVHRHTHRVVRGSLIVCGRPDGRLSALTSLEASCCLSVNQASSIQSIGSTAESITIGHNPFQLPLSARVIAFDRHRPLFLCEKMLDKLDAESIRRRNNLELSMGHSTSRRIRRQAVSHAILAVEDDTVHKGYGGATPSAAEDVIAFSNCARLQFSKSISDASTTTQKKDVSFDRVPVGQSQTMEAREIPTQIERCSSAKSENIPFQEPHRSSIALLGAYMNIQKYWEEERCLDSSGRVSTDYLLETSIQQRKWREQVRELFGHLDTDGDGALNKHEFVSGCLNQKSDFSTNQLNQIFDEYDVNASGRLSLTDFIRIIKLPEMEIAYKSQLSVRDENGIIQVQASNESYFGEACMKGLKMNKLKDPALICATKAQDFAQELYESRIASMQRFVGMTVMFYEMGSLVERFFHRISLGLLSYRYDRTHSIVRIATTASPVSGADVGERKRILKTLRDIHHAVHIISVSWLTYKRRKEENYLARLESVARKSEIL